MEEEKKKEEKELTLNDVMAEVYKRLRTIERCQEEIRALNVEINRREQAGEK